MHNDVDFNIEMVDIHSRLIKFDFDDTSVSGVTMKLPVVGRAIT